MRYFINAIILLILIVSNVKADVGDSCDYSGTPGIYDCSGSCVDAEALSYVGDGYCNDNEFYNLNCAYFNFDGGDCLPCPADDFGNTCAAAYTLKPKDVPISGRLCSIDMNNGICDWDMFEITAPINGYLNAYTTLNADTVGFLWLAGGAECGDESAALISNDDFSDLNFNFVYPVIAGTKYTIGVRGYDCGGGSYLLYVEYTSELPTTTTTVPTTTTTTAISSPDYYVAPPPVGDDVHHTGTSPNSAFATIAHAIYAASGTEGNPVTIHVAGGMYAENINMNNYESLEGGWNSSFTQRWDFDNQGLEPTAEFKTVIDGGGAAVNKRCIYMEFATYTNLFIDGFTIQNGVLTGTNPELSTIGGGICFIGNANPKIANCTFLNNSAYYGGAFFNSDSSPVLINCSFKGNNSAAAGGAVCNLSNSSLQVTNCSFSENHAQSNGYGGGIYNDDTSNVMITNSKFTNNGSVGGGGAILSYNVLMAANCTFTGNYSINNSAGAIFNTGSATINNCIFYANTSSYFGGAVFNNNYRAGSFTNTITNCLFYSNSGVYGGAVAFHASATQMTNCTIYGNNATNYGGGLSISASSLYPSSPTITNCIIWGNTAPGNREIYIQDASPSITYCDIRGGYTGTGNINLNPLFVDADGTDNILGTQDDDFHLQAGSPCIDAGTSDNAPATDIEDNPRYDDPGMPNNGGGIYPYYDIGAYENQNATPPTTTTTILSTTTTSILPTTTTTSIHLTTTTTALPTVVELSSFTAISKAGKVILNWNTESEIDNAGFNLYRSESENGEYIKINTSLISAKGSPTQGASYEFIDNDVQNRKTYYYKLEDIDLNGNSTMHGPVSATPRWIFGIFGK